MSTVTLQRVDDILLPKLLDVAVADADADEVMPPVPGQPGWNDVRRAAFCEFHRPTDDVSYAVVVDGRIVGAARLAPTEAPGAVEASIWLARSVRGKGYSVHALHLLIDKARARGATALIAQTQAENAAAVAALRALGATLWEDPDTGSVHATLRVGEAD